MLLLHGLRDSARSFDEFAAAMRGEHHVVALDSRGHGDSGWPASGAYRFEDLVSDVDATVEHLDASHGRGLVMVGHSAGGRYAWAYAVEHPEAVRALIIIDIDPDPINPQTQRDFEAFHSEPLVWDSMDPVIEKLRNRPMFAAEAMLRRQAQAITRDHPDGGVVWKSDPLVMAEYERPDLWASWSKIQCPTLIVRGRRSTLLTHETAVKMREALPKHQVRLAELEDAAHWLYQDTPAAFEATVRWFLAGLDSDA
jgi:pimeloyl-ACP methyl ester carboxylesterase|tara:strand:- start:2614 stop:3375 length:762 start_codon:yes stop_codon:yes gene_type:complete